MTDLYRKLILRKGLGALPPQPDKSAARQSVTDYVPTQPDEKRLWATGPVLDQGRVGACVGFGWTAELIAEPFPDKVGRKLATRYAFNHYERARALSGTSGSSGTTGLSGAQVAIERGLVGSCARPESMEHIRDAVVGVGPVLITVPWLVGMSRCKPDGQVKVNWRDDGSKSGFHFLCITGYDPARKSEGRTGPAYRLRNSWGKKWGARVRKSRRWPKPRTGDGWIWADDLERLLRWKHETYLDAYLPIGRRPVDLRALLAD